jgi:hypothetical protein
MRIFLTPPDMPNTPEVKMAREKIASANPTNQVKKIRATLDIIDTTVLMRQDPDNPYSEVTEMTPWDESELQAIKDKLLTLMHGL